MPLPLIKIPSSLPVATAFMIALFDTPRMAAASTMEIGLDGMV
jgi:hypothetical protein